MKVIRANAFYTGGGFYQYCGATDNGTYLLSYTDWESVMEVDADPEQCGDECDYGEWQVDHHIREIDGKEYRTILLEMINWICDNRPDGNYTISEIEAARKDLLIADIREDLGSALTDIFLKKQEELGIKTGDCDPWVEHQYDLAADALLEEIVNVLNYQYTFNR